MKLWLDAQLPPSLALWIASRFKIEAYSVKDLNLLAAKDEEVFLAARKEKAVVISKDIDFVRLVEQKGSPPQLIWVTCGNTSNSNLRRIFESTLEDAVRIIRAGDDIVEIGEA
jgi:predicted nuclease of predicted toxin-antitoxin system